MPQTVNINGVAISYPVIGDTEWGVEATKFAELVGVVLQKIGQGNQSTTNNIVIGSISSPGNLAVASGDLSVSGNTALTGNLTIGGVIIADDSTNVTTAPPISFTGDLNTGIGHSSADTLDFVTGGNPRFRIESTGQIKAVYESTLGTDYNTQLDNGYLCRAWVNFDGTGTVAIRASGNVSSITDNGTGDYTVNFASEMPDANYAMITNAQRDDLTQPLISSIQGTQTVNGVDVTCRTDAGNFADSPVFSVGVFR
jgi:hypothetical protein